MFNKLRLELIKESPEKYTSNKISSPDDIMDIAVTVLRLDRQAEEVFCILTLDTKNNITGSFEVSRGTVNSSLVHPREVFKRALLNNATSIILLHNHPTGDISPSPSDIEITDTLAQCGELLKIKVLDHLIIGDERYFSFKIERLLT